MEKEIEKNLSPDYNRGQHLLVDEEYIRKFAAEIPEGMKVLEIGAGKGIITREIAKRHDILAFEIDEKFRDELVKIDRAEIVFGDAMKASWKGFYVVGNIPFNLSEDAVRKGIYDDVEGMLFIMGERFRFNFEKSRIGIFAGLFYNSDFLFEIPREVFEPAPGTGAWAVKFTRKKEPGKKAEIVRRILARKGKIKNAIVSSLMDMGAGRREAKKIVLDFGLNEAALGKPAGRITGALLERIIEGLERIIDS